MIQQPVSSHCLPHHLYEIPDNTRQEFHTELDHLIYCKPEVLVLDHTLGCTDPGMFRMSRHLGIDVQYAPDATFTIIDDASCFFILMQTDGSKPIAHHRSLVLRRNTDTALPLSALGTLDRSAFRWMGETPAWRKISLSDSPCTQQRSFSLTIFNTL
jgi:hypothetical protein